ncbi:MAG: hypothetical protein HC893_15740 [Chloroflexaceae bacterium]|nr:hypothetical protein [Chloroflexaceae bacterium]
MTNQSTPTRPDAVRQRAAPLIIFVLVGGIIVLGLLARLVAPAPPAAPAPQPIDNAMYGMVIRDPWYDFGSIPAAPNAPNYAAQDLMGPCLNSLVCSGCGWSFILRAAI